MFKLRSSVTQSLSTVLLGSYPTAWIGAASLLCLSLSTVSLAEPQKACTYNLDASTAAVKWTAYKTTDKVGVNGGFTKFNVDGSLKSKNLSSLLKGLKVSVDLSSGETSNPARDKTLSEYFFTHLGKGAVGKVKDVSEKDKTLLLSLTLNGKTADVPMTYEWKTDAAPANGAFEATGTLDLMKFNGSEALASINKQCFELHKGKDGVSKTWSEVKLQLIGTISETCH